MQYEIFDEDLDAAARAAVALLRTVMLQGNAAYNSRGEETVEAAKFLLRIHLAHRAHGTGDGLVGLDEDVDAEDEGDGDD